MKELRRKGMKDIEGYLRSAMANGKDLPKARLRLAGAECAISMLMEEIHTLLDKFSPMNTNPPTDTSNHFGDNNQVKDSTAVIGSGSLSQMGDHFNIGDGNHIIINHAGAPSSDIESLLARFIAAAERVALAIPAGDDRARFETSTTALQREVTSVKPSRQWYEVSMQGVLEAAGKVGEVGKPLLEIANMIAAMVVPKLGN